MIINEYPNSLIYKLAVEELKFCCVWSFLQETKVYSARKIALALGVSNRTITYWRNKKRKGQITQCPRCPGPQTRLQLKKTTSGRVYFVRHQPL